MGRGFAELLGHTEETGTLIFLSFFARCFGTGVTGLVINPQLTENCF